MGTTPTVSSATPSGSTVHPSGSATWALRLAGLSALVNGAGFGAFDVPAIWHLAREHRVWYAWGNPTYGNGPFEAHGITVTVPVLVVFLGACLVLAIGGVLLLMLRPAGVVVTLSGLVMGAPFWWGFDLPFAWINAAAVLALLAMARVARTRSRVRGRALLITMLGLLFCEVVGGFVALASGADTWNEAWGFETQHTVPLPVGLAQLALAWAAARNTRPPVGLIAAVLLSVFCLISLLAGLFDGDLIGNVESDGVLSMGVVWAGVLLVVTGAVGVLAAVRAKELRVRH